MRLSRLYSRLPTDNNGNSLLSDLSDLHTTINGSNGETITMVSYFQKDLRIGLELNFLINKYVVFVENGNTTNNNSFGWSLVLKNSQGNNINSTYEITEINDSSQEYAFKIKDTDNLLTIKEIEVTCTMSIGNQSYSVSLIHPIRNTDSDIFQIPNNISILGNPDCTYFIANHLRDFIRTYGSINVGTINLVTGIIYQNILDSFPSILLFNKFIGNFFDDEITNFSYKNGIEGITDYNGITDSESGLCSLKISLLWMFFDVNSNFERSADLDQITRDGFNNSENQFIGFYHLATFPKSSIKYSIEIFKMLLGSFQNECDPPSNKFIYNTFKAGTDNSNMLLGWKTTEFKDINSNNLLIGNILLEYFNGPQNFVSVFLFSSRYIIDLFPIQKHDWSPYVLNLIGDYQVCTINAITRSHFVIHCTAGNMTENAIKSETGITSGNKKRSKAHIYVLADGRTIEVWPFTEVNVWATKIESQQNLKGQMFHVELNYGSPTVPSEDQYQTLADLYIQASNIQRCWPIIVPHIEVDRGLADGHSDPTDFNYNHFYNILEQRGVPMNQVTKFDHNRYWGEPSYKVPWATDTNYWPPVLTGNPHS